MSLITWLYVTPEKYVLTSQARSIRIFWEWHITTCVSVSKSVCEHCTIILYPYIYMYMKWWCFRPILCPLFRLNWAKQTPGDNEAKLMTKLAPEWVRTSDPVIRIPARYRWATAPASIHIHVHPSNLLYKWVFITWKNMVRVKYDVYMIMGGGGHYDACKCPLLLFITRRHSVERIHPLCQKVPLSLYK